MLKQSLPSVLTLSKQRLFIETGDYCQKERKMLTLKNMRTLFTLDMYFTVGWVQESSAGMSKPEWIIPQNYPLSLCSDFVLTKSLSDYHLVSHVLWYPKEDNLDDKFIYIYIISFYHKSIPEWQWINLNYNISQTFLLRITWHIS